MVTYRARRHFEVYQFEVLDLKVALSPEGEEQIAQIEIDLSFLLR